MDVPFDQRSTIPVPAGMLPRDEMMKVCIRLASTKRTAIGWETLNTMDGRESGPGFARWSATRIHRSGTMGEVGGKHWNDRDVRAVIKKRMDHCGDEF